MIRVEQRVCTLIYSPSHPSSSAFREGREWQQEGCARQGRRVSILSFRECGFYRVEVTRRRGWGLNADITE